MQITRNSLNTVLAPADQSTGDVYLDMIGSPSDASRLGAAVVHFTPGARSTWHTHLRARVYIQSGAFTHQPAAPRHPNADGRREWQRPSHRSSLQRA